MMPEPCAVLCDLDGVVWLAHQPIPGSVEAIAELRGAGHRVLFVTNNSASTVATQEAALAAIGIPAVGDVLTSSVAAALLIEPGERVHVCGGPGIVEAVEQRGGIVVDGESCAAVMVGFHRNFDFAGLTVAARLIRNGARLIGTNDDATYPTPDGPIPGGGSILAAVATASGATPAIAGKPHPPMAQLVRAIIGDAAAQTALMVGDRPETDGLFASQLGCRFALVWSGVTGQGAAVHPPPDIAADDLAAVATIVLANDPISDRGITG
jgi:4-nitrophenyl phosphatase